MTFSGPASTSAQRGQTLSGLGPARVQTPPSQTVAVFSGRSPQTGQPLPQRYALLPPPTRKLGRLSLRCLRTRGWLGTSDAERHAGRKATCGWMIATDCIFQPFSHSLMTWPTSFLIDGWWSSTRSRLSRRPVCSFTLHFLLLYCIFLLIFSNSIHFSPPPSSSGEGGVCR